jgi:hypothetical protein
LKRYTDRAYEEGKDLEVLRGIRISNQRATWAATLLMFGICFRLLYLNARLTPTLKSHIGCRLILLEAFCRQINN